MIDCSWAKIFFWFEKVLKGSRRFDVCLIRESRRKTGGMSVTVGESRFGDHCEQAEKSSSTDLDRIGREVKMIDAPLACEPVLVAPDFPS